MQGYPQQQHYDPYAQQQQQQPQQQAPQHQQQQQQFTEGGGYASYYSSAQHGASAFDSYANPYGQQRLPQAQQGPQYQQSSYIPGQQASPQQAPQQQQQHYAPSQDPQYTSGVYSAATALPNGAATSPAVPGAAAHSARDSFQPSSVADSAPPHAPNATDVNGLRWTWSTYPNTQRDVRQEPASVASISLPEMIVPLACMYTPLQPIDTSRLVVGDPAAKDQQCQSCGAFWNKHCYREDKFWVCASCLRRHPMPANYNPQHPALLHDTVEYILPPDDNVTTHPTFVFVVDTCLPVEELDALKAGIMRCLDWLPPHSLVGLVTFGTRVSVWELGGAVLARSYNVRGDRPYEPTEVAAMLQFSDSAPVLGRFLVPLEECEFVLTTLIEDLQCDGVITPANKRPLRTTGTAVAIAVSLLESLDENKCNTSVAEASNKKNVNVRGKGVVECKKAGRILLFTGGPCTRGPGTVVGVEKEQMMRFHREIMEGEIPYYEAAAAFYKSLQKRLSEVNACLDVFAESFDQVGTLEMRESVDSTGGTFVCGDTFNHQMFTKSLQRYFERCDQRCHGQEPSVSPSGVDDAGLVVRTAFGVRFEVYTSADTLVSGVLGPCIVDEKANKAKPPRASSPLQIGIGGTTRWCVSTIDHGVTYTFLFDTATMDKKSADSEDKSSARRDDLKRRFVQFVTRFHTPYGASRVRVTSVTLPIAPSHPRIDPQFFAQHQAFDQTCAATVLARMVVSILEKHPNKLEDTKRWLDTLLVRFVRRYGTFSPGKPESLRLSPCLSLFPSFLFNLRRSEYFMVLNISPDETAFKRHWLMREDVDNCVLMIQPTLYSYDIEVPTSVPVPLDSCSLRPDNILLMDAYFNMHIMWGTTIYAWIQANYHENPDYGYFADLLNTVESDAISLLDTRYPYPRFSRTDANGSEARHIKTRMNPTTTHHSSGPNDGAHRMRTGLVDQSDVIYTDEASIVKFMESLKQAVVSVERNVGSGGYNTEGGNGISSSNSW